MDITGTLWAVIMAGLFAILGIWAFMKVGKQAGRFAGAVR